MLSTITHCGLAEHAIQTITHVMHDMLSNLASYVFFHLMISALQVFSVMQSKFVLLKLHNKCVTVTLFSWDKTSAKDCFPGSVRGKGALENNIYIEILVVHCSDLSCNVLVLTALLVRIKQNDPLKNYSNNQQSSVNVADCFLLPEYIWIASIADE